MRLLAIETSCDETAAAVLDVLREETAADGIPRAVVRSDVVSSQIADHAPYGGVVPELASRRHLVAILPVVRGALDGAATDLRALDSVAVTSGPGLVGSLLVGVQVAKAIADVRGIPIIGVHHLAGHLVSALLERPDAPRARPAFPHVALVASGGHTALYRVDGPERRIRLGATRDDAAGEAFDKVGKSLGLPYPGGPSIDRAAQGADPGDLRFPRGLDRRGTLDFSFSGLKTAVAEHLAARKDAPDEAETARIAAAFQRSVVASLVRKSVRACEAVGIPRLVIGGGVAANGALREALAAACGRERIDLFLPERRDCTDNAAMIGLAAVPRLLRGENDGATLGARATWDLPETPESTGG